MPAPNASTSLCGSIVAVRGALEVEIDTSSADLGWEGTQVETGRKVGPWVLEDHGSPRHFLAISLSEAPYMFEAKQRGSYRRLVMEPGGISIGPGGEGFSKRGPDCRYGVVALDTAGLERLAGVADVRLEPQFAVRDPQLEALMRVLLVEAATGGRNGALFVETVSSAVAQHLANAHASRASVEADARGGLHPRRLGRVFELVEAGLATGPSLVEMADVAGLSPFHFAREFKREVGMSPHQFLVARRLERAHELLRRGDRTVGDIAQAVGFADQSHLTRAFRARYGTTPGRVLRGS